MIVGKRLYSRLYESNLSMPKMAFLLPFLPSPTLTFWWRVNRKFRLGNRYVYLSIVNIFMAEFLIFSFLDLFSATFKRRSFSFVVNWAPNFKKVLTLRYQLWKLQQRQVGKRIGQPSKHSRLGNALHYYLVHDDKGSPKQEWKDSWRHLWVRKAFQRTPVVSQNIWGPKYIQK